MKTNIAVIPEKNAFRLILNTKIFSIPADSSFLVDIEPDIYTKLIKNHYYEIKSNVSIEVFEMFLNFL